MAIASTLPTPFLRQRLVVSGRDNYKAVSDLQQAILNNSDRHHVYLLLRERQVLAVGINQ